MKIIVAIDNNWGIGKDGQLLFHIPEDLEYFKEHTSGKTVVMGRKTLESLPNGKPLQGRRNIVLTSSNTLKEEDGLEIVHSFEELFQLIDMDNSEDVYIIGGATLYNNLYKKCNELLVTKICADGNADTFIENIDDNPDYMCSYVSPMKEYQGISYKFTKYRKKEHP